MPSVLCGLLSGWPQGDHNVVVGHRTMQRSVTAAGFLLVGREATVVSLVGSEAAKGVC